MVIPVEIPAKAGFLSKYLKNTGDFKSVFQSFTSFKHPISIIWASIWNLSKHNRASLPIWMCL